jgi:hypothetical protein
MDETIRRALIRAAITFAAILVIGSSGVFVARNLGSDELQAETTQTPTGSPASPAGPTPREAWLAWVPGGLPEGFGSTLTTVPEVSLATTATAGIAWMTRSLDSAGLVIDDPEDPYMIPMDVTGVEPVFASFVPEPERRLVEGLEPGEAIFSESAAALRGLSEGATLEFQPEVSVSVIGTLPDQLTGGYEVLMTRATAETVGVSRERYVLFNATPQAEAETLEESFLPLIPPDSPFPVVEVRAPGDVPYLRANDRELPPIQLKVRFGEFPAQPGAEGSIEIDPTWTQEHIITAPIPRLGAVTCHRKAVYLLKQAMKELTREDLDELVVGAGVCFIASADPDSPDGPLTSRAFGASIEINPLANEPGSEPDQDMQVVNMFEKWGFGWAGTDAWPQGALFRYQRPPTPA